MSAERLDAAAFERLVVEELDALPDDAVAGLENAVFATEDEPDDGAPLLGRYEGTDLTHRERYGFGELPDRIVLFRRPLLAVTRTDAELRAEVRTTLLHEIGHYYGLDDDRLGELGWG